MLKPVLPDLDPEDEKAQQKELEERYQPLTEWLKKQAGDAVREGEVNPW